MVSWWHYARAVATAARRPGQPLAHLVLSPLVPLAKYVLPLGVTVAAIRFTNVDCMVYRILADDDVRRARLEAEEAAAAAPGSRGPA